MFGSSEKSVEQKPLKDVNFLSVYVYVYKLCLYGYVCTPVEADVPKLRWVHMGCVRPKIKQCGSCIPTTKCVTPS